MNSRILLVEDEPGLVLTLGDRLRSEGYAVDALYEGTEVVERATRDRFGLIILDVMLPGKGGFEVCEELRQRGFTTPILILTARTQMADKVKGLKIGADDYLTKPFEMAELLARVEALLRRGSRAGTEGPDFYDCGPLHIDMRRSEVLRDGSPAPLSTKEFQLLRYLLEHRGRTVSREELLKEVWGYASAPSTRTVDVHVAWLRQKLENDPKQPKYILTVHGQGYKFAA
ncbi:MAG: response regulator transcription factor [Terriglobia bacterium]|jgi:two-component system alkaline phosphatase synthesis response regulator PhoP